MTGGQPGGARMREIAAQRLAALRAMRTLSAEEPRVLAAVDAAARGEIGQGAADELVASHLSARDACIAAMRAHDEEWRTLAQGAPGWSADDAEAITGLSRESLALLAEIDASDARFAAELVARRSSASSELARADSARAAQRAYGAGGSPNAPRFTDRRG
ncbi:MAG: hypothetical protein RL325_1824 [Planctomycetota bacterium]